MAKRTPTVTEARDAAIVRICDCECTSEYGHSSSVCRTAGIVKIDALIAAVRAEQQATITALVGALREAQRAIKSLRIDALGMGQNDDYEWALRDELLTQMRAALALVPPAQKET